MKRYTIRDIREQLIELGITYSLDQIRKLERMGLLESKRNPDNNYRVYDDNLFKKSVRDVVLYFTGTSIEDIKKNVPEEMQKRIKYVMVWARILKDKNNIVISEKG